MPHRRRPHRPLALDASHWRADGQPKVRFGSRSEAVSAAYERAQEAEAELGVYQCAFCQGWHMGRRDGRRGAGDDG